MQRKPILICIVGPTAIGKTSLSIKVAKAFNAEIISADSRQFYKEMKIGTAVPSEEELASSTHHFIQHKSITENYTVGHFEKEALQKLDSLFETSNFAVLVGGSGLYIDAVIKGLDEFPAIPIGIRDSLNTILKTEGIENLQKQLKKVDPIYYTTIDIQNPHRLIRALEVYNASGKPYSTFLNQPKKQRNFTPIFIGINAEREVIYNRINKRVDIMMTEGLLKEASALLKYKALNALQTVGYRELFQYFDELITLDEAVEEIKKNTRRFAKRQLTWFKKNTNITWFDYTTEASKVVTYIKTKSTQ